MKEQLFTTGNVKKFFNTSTEGLPGNVSGLVKTLNTHYGEAAYAIAQQYSESPWIAQPVISDMLGSYGTAVAVVIHGQPGNA